jgi:hypothetical protein
MSFLACVDVVVAFVVVGFFFLQKENLHKGYVYFLIFFFLDYFMGHPVKKQKVNTQSPQSVFHRPQFDVALIDTFSF